LADACSHRITGYTLTPGLNVYCTEATPELIPETTCGKPGGLIHHSGRDIQYVYPSYTRQPKEHHAAISMTGNRNPPENAMTGRVNGILKQEQFNPYESNDIAMCATYRNRPLIPTTPEGRIPAATRLLLFRLWQKPEKARTGGKSKKTQTLKKPQQTGLSDVKDNMGCLKVLKTEPFEEVIQTSVLSLN
jgi:hypothetical protein